MRLLLVFYRFTMNESKFAEFLLIDISLLKTTHIWLLNFCNNLISIIDKLANYYLNQNRYKKVTHVIFVQPLLMQLLPFNKL